MPNHVINEIRVHGATREEVAPLVSNRHRDNDAPLIDFEILVPLPNYGWPGNVGKEHKEHFQTTDLDEAVKRWGTKWNAYESSFHVDALGDVLLRFKTAWDTPRGWTVALYRALKFQRPISVFWLSEGGLLAQHEKYSLHPDWGPQWTKSEIPVGSPEYKHLHFLLWGATPEEMNND